MRTLVAVAALCLLGATAAPQQCQTERESGYLAICVQRDGGCHCACVKDASAGIERLKELMRVSGASDEAIREAARLFRELPKKANTSESFSVRDGEVTYNVSARQG
jgi:hypothetical protein